MGGIYPLAESNFFIVLGGVYTLRGVPPNIPIPLHGAREHKHASHNPYPGVSPSHRGSTYAHVGMEHSGAGVAPLLLAHPPREPKRLTTALHLHLTHGHKDGRGRYSNKDRRGYGAGVSRPRMEHAHEEPVQARTRRAGTGTHTKSTKRCPKLIGYCSLLSF